MIDLWIGPGGYLRVGGVSYFYPGLARLDEPLACGGGRGFAFNLFDRA